MATPVTLSPLADIIKLCFLGSGKYAGFLDLPALCKLQKEFTIEYTAVMIASNSQKDKLTSTKTTESHNTYDCLVRIVVNGVKSEERAVSKLLSEAGLILQHPFSTELYRYVHYHNPHYLLRPGSQMPTLEALFLLTDRTNVVSDTSLDEVEKSRFMQIFNSANGPASTWNVTPSPRLRSTLKDHQVTALAMMMEKECGIVDNAKFPTLWNSSNSSGVVTQYRHKITGISQRNPIPVYGGILADEMGLGKSLSLLALVSSSLDSLADQDTPDIGVSQATLIVTPKSTIPGWQQQVKSHFHVGTLRQAVYHGKSRRQVALEFSQTDIVLTTYETLRREYAAKGPLFTTSWRRVVLDEAHHVRNRSSEVFEAVCSVSSRSRWCLTGTPIHNSLDDYGALLSFLGVPLLMDKSQFDFWITSPINRKQPNSLTVLEDLVRATCLRRTKEVVQDSLQLPLRRERIAEIKLHQKDQELYELFRGKTTRIVAGLAKKGEISPGMSKGNDVNVLTLINLLRRICNHGEDLLPQSALEAWRANSTSMDWEMMRSCNKTCDSCECLIEELDFLSDDIAEFDCHHSFCVLCTTQCENTGTEEVRRCPKCAAKQTGSDHSASRPKPTFRFSAKVEALMQNLRTEQTLEQHESKTLPVKSVIFSQWTKMLDLIAGALTHHGFQFQRIDGQSSLKQRSTAIQQFKSNPACTVMIATVGSAGEGVELTAANHVHLIEPHWSPMAEAQAIDRVHRIGQTRDVMVTRYIVSDTIENYIQWVQHEKLELISHSLGSNTILQSEIEDARWKTLQKALGVSDQ
ncbi:hypothetical protein DL98DRAFT_558686, partial [Cadophora sp. DSE1049]